MNKDVLDTHIVPGLSRAARALLSMTTRGFAYVAPPARTLDDKPTAQEVLEWIRLEHSTTPLDEPDTAQVEAWKSSTPRSIPGIDWSAPSPTLYDTTRRARVLDHHTVLYIEGSLDISVGTDYICITNVRPFAGAYPLTRRRAGKYPRVLRRGFNPNHPGQDVADWMCFIGTGVRGPSPTLLETLLENL